MPGAIDFNAGEKDFLPSSGARNFAASLPPISKRSKSEAPPRLAVSAIPIFRISPPAPLRTGLRATVASTSKCLAQSNKSRGADKATKKQH
jgi:hypothetical protein